MVIAFSPSAKGISIENVAVDSLRVLVMIGDMAMMSDLFAVVPWIVIDFASVNEPEAGAVSSSVGMTTIAGGATVGISVADAVATGVFAFRDCCLLIDKYTAPVATKTPKMRPNMMAMIDSLFIRYFDCTRKCAVLQVSSISSSRMKYLIDSLLTIYDV